MPPTATLTRIESPPPRRRLARPDSVCHAPVTTVLEPTGGDELAAADQPVPAELLPGELTGRQELADPARAHLELGGRLGGGEPRSANLHLRARRSLDRLHWWTSFRPLSVSGDGGGNGCPPSRGTGQSSAHRRIANSGL